MELLLPRSKSTIARRHVVVTLCPPSSHLPHPIPSIHRSYFVTIHAFWPSSSSVIFNQNQSSDTHAPPFPPFLNAQSSHPSIHTHASPLGSAALQNPPRSANTRCKVAPPSRLYSEAILSSALERKKGKVNGEKRRCERLTG